MPIAPANEKPSLVPPDEAVWFGLEVLADDGEWERCDDTTMGGKWWKVAVIRPQDVAEAFQDGGSAGSFRVIWARQDRRSQIGASVPFTVAPPADPNQAPQAEPPPPPEPVHQHPDAPQPEPPAPDPKPAVVAPEQKPTPAKPSKRKSNGGGATHPSMPPGIPIEALTGGELHPLGQVVLLKHIAAAETDRTHSLLLKGMDMIVQNERSRSQEHLRTMQQYYETMDKLRSDFMAQLMTMNAAATEASKPSEATQQLKEQIAKLSESVQELADDDDDQRDALTAIAKLSENPNDLERTLAGVQNMVGMLANSPLGQALADSLTRAGQQQGDEP